MSCVGVSSILAFRCKLCPLMGIADLVSCVGPMVSGGPCVVNAKFAVNS